jgi:hypothetical protein
MAAGGGKMQIVDSEDEPLSSSPVNVLDGVADKLSDATSVPSHHAQDARQKDAEETSAPDSAIITADRIDYMAVEQKNDPIEAQPSQTDPTNSQLHNHTSTPGNDAEDGPSIAVPDVTQSPANTDNMTAEGNESEDVRMVDEQEADGQASLEAQPSIFTHDLHPIPKVATQNSVYSEIQARPEEHDSGPVAEHAVRSLTLLLLSHCLQTCRILVPTRYLWSRLLQMKPRISQRTRSARCRKILQYRQAAQTRRKLMSILRQSTTNN